MLASAPKSTLVFPDRIVTLLVVMLLLAISANAQYTKTNLTGDVQGEGNFTDPHLKNGWGLAAVRSSIAGTFWVADEGTGLATVYSSTGQPSSIVVTIPTASGQGTGSPAGLVANTTSSFKITKGAQTAPAQFLFSTLDGTISGWNPTVDPTHAVIAVNNSASGALYTGLAIAFTNQGNFIYAADSAGNKVDIFDGNFNFVRSFTDTNLPPGFTPYGIQVFSSTLYVTYAISFPKIPAAMGFVDTYDLAGGSQKRLIEDSSLNQPWGVAVAPPNFGPLANSLLVANLGDGLINAYNRSTGVFLGTLKQNGSPIVISGLWGITFAPNSRTTTPSKLFFAAGPGGYIHGLFGVITAN